MVAGREDRGRYVVVAGPDGAGKSTFADALADAIGSVAVARYHHRIGSLPRRPASLVPTETPHLEQPYPSLLSRVKVGYLFVDYLLGTLLRVRPAVRRGTWVILERGWWDLAIDPRRYRLSAGGTLVRRLDRLLPQPHLLVVLEAPPDVLAGRKAELPLPEIERQRLGWRAVAADGPLSLILDAQRPVDDLVRATLDALGGPTATAPRSDRSDRSATSTGGSAE
jgi:thymidylate kinase